MRPSTLLETATENSISQNSKFMPWKDISQLPTNTKSSIWMAERPMRMHILDIR